MGLLSKSRKSVVFVCILLLVFVFLVSAQERGDVEGTITNLGRKSKILVDKLKNTVAKKGLDAGSVDIGVQLESGLGVLDAFFASLSMILVSEIGDETFIIAALMAMRHPKSIVLSGALSALFVMTILSTGLGRIVPNLISRKHTNSAATVLYAFFGLRLLYIAWRSDPKGSQKKEIEEVEEKLESGQGKTAIRRIFSRFCTPIFLEAFILTFLAEWGDRSQIATIALATHKNAIGVAVGAAIGHTICTSVAVVGDDKDEDNESLSDRSLKNIPSLLAVPKFQSLLKNFKNLPQLFVYKDDEVEDDDDDTGMDIGFPTDVKHVTHIGIDGTSTSILSRGWDGYFTPTSEIAIPQEHDELNAILPSQDSSHHEVQNACNNHYNPQSLQRAMAGLNINSKSCGI